MKIDRINLNFILNSRREKTIEIRLQSGRHTAISSVPSGKSRGSYEVIVLEPEKILSCLNFLKKKIIGYDFITQQEFDRFLCFLDGTVQKKKLGGNLILALSLAWARLKAKKENKELFRYIAQLNHYNIQLKNFPVPLFNVINGGLHACNTVTFQEFLIIPENIEFPLALKLGKQFYRFLKKQLEKKFGADRISIGDEAGFSAPFNDHIVVLNILKDIINKKNFPFRLGLDVAASQCFYSSLRRRELNFINDGYYLVNQNKYTVSDLQNFYLQLLRDFNILYLEDPFCEEDFDAFAALMRKIKFFHKKHFLGDRRNSDNKGNKGKLSSFLSKDLTILVADDLTVSNVHRLKLAIQKKSANALIIKPNQVGTLTETLETVEMARRSQWLIIVSHRSGETMDDFIADLAVGVGAWGIKAGSPAAPERLVKYNRLNKIYRLLE
jgi:enolase